MFADIRPVFPTGPSVFFFFFFLGGGGGGGATGFQFK